MVILDDWMMTTSSRRSVESHQKLTTGSIVTGAVRQGEMNMNLGRKGAD